jgi:hypothetical protein
MGFLTGGENYFLNGIQSTMPGSQNQAGAA